MPVISNLQFFVTASTIVATWNTDVPADSNLFVNGPGAVNKAAIDNGYDGSVTSHSCVVVGLTAGSIYACHVTSGGVSSTPQDKTTLGLPVRLVITGVTIGASITGVTGYGDTNFSFLSNDGNEYVTSCDGVNFGAVSDNINVGKITSYTTPAGTLVNGFSNFGAENTYDGTDGPAGISLTNKWGGCLFGMAGNLFGFLCRNNNRLDPDPPAYNGGILYSPDHGATWGNWQNPGTTNANGIEPSPVGSTPYANTNIGFASPIRYAADDGTLGYTTAGNCFDGGNAFVYQMVLPNADYAILQRVPRKALNTLSNLTFQFWAGPANPQPADFTNDANWTTTYASATQIFVSPSGLQMFWGHITFVPAINSYLLQFDDANGKEFFASAITPAGPWQVFYANASPVGDGMCLLHSDVSANSATNNLSMRMTYSLNNTFNLVAATWTTGIPMIQLISYAFTTVENPLSDGGNFSNVITNNHPLQVPSSGVCEASSTDASHFSMGSWVGAGGVSADGNWANDQYAEVTIKTTSSGGNSFQGPAVRITSSGGYFITLQANQLQIFKINSTGSATSLLTNSGVTTTTGDVWRLQVIGSTLTVFKNGSSVSSTTDSTYTGGNPGCVAYTNGGAVTLAQFSLFAAGANQASAPTFSQNNTTLTISSTSGGTIYYTTDGSTPTHSSSSISSGGTINVSGVTTVKAIASVADNADSTVSTYTMFVITGNCGIGGTSIAYSGTGSGTVTANSSGDFTISSLAPGSYTLTPSNAGDIFSPLSQSISLSANAIMIFTGYPSSFSAIATLTQTATENFTPNANPLNPSNWEKGAANENLQAINSTCEATVNAADDCVESWIGTTLSNDQYIQAKLARWIVGNGQDIILFADTDVATVLTGLSFAATDNGAGGTADITLSDFNASTILFENASATVAAGDVFIMGSVGKKAFLLHNGVLLFSGPWSGGTGTIAIECDTEVGLTDCALADVAMGSVVAGTGQPSGGGGFGPGGGGTGAGPFTFKFGF